MSRQIVEAALGFNVADGRTVDDREDADAGGEGGLDLHTGKLTLVRLETRGVVPNNLVAFVERLEAVRRCGEVGQSDLVRDRVGPTAMMNALAVIDRFTPSHPRVRFADGRHGFRNKIVEGCDWLEGHPHLVLRVDLEDLTSHITPEATVDLAYCGVVFDPDGERLLLKL